MRLSDRVTGLFLVVLGAAAAYAGSRLPPVPGQQVGPNVFPLVIGIALGLCGAMIALGIGSRFEREAEADVLAHSDQPLEDPALAAHGPLYMLRVLLPPAALVFYALVVDTFGFFVTAAAMILAGALAFGAGLRLAVAMAIGAPIVIHLVFYKLLRVPLPAGLVPMPW
jgi:putative tricarboxylic transport membrane protein